MQDEQIEAVRELAAKGQAFGPMWETFLESAFFIHGHVCGGMPLGFRARLAALRALSAERELNMGKLIVVETGTGRAAGCFTDGVQFSTGCTFGKGLMRRSEYGKWALNLIERGSRRAARVSVRPEAMQASFDSAFVKMRHQGIAPTQVPLDVSRTLVEGLLARHEADLFLVSEPFEYPLGESPAANFNLIFCANCREAVAENKARLKDGKSLCLPCSGYGSYSLVMTVPSAESLSPNCV